MRMNFLVLAVGLMVLPLHAHAAKIKVYPVVIDTEATRATINIVNEGKDPLVLEAQGIKNAANQEIGVFPPVATLQPGSRQVFRLILPPEPKQTQAWKVRISEVQPKTYGENSSGGQVRNELAFEIPVFQSPRGAMADLVREGDKVRNAGNRQVLITRIGSRATHRYLMPGEVIDAAQDERLYTVDMELKVR